MLARALPGAATAMAALLFSACSSGDNSRNVTSDSTAAPAAQPAGDAASTGPNVVTITSADFNYESPAEIPAGLTTFKLVNAGPSLHHVQLVKLGEGKTADDFIAALKAGGPPPRWATEAGGPNPPEVGDTATVTMAVEPGNYVMLCFVPSADGMPHVMKGMIKPLKVTGTPRSGVAEPKADLVMKLMDYDFQLSQPLKAGKQIIEIDNGGAQPHEVAIIKLKPGKKPVDFANWGMKPVGPAPASIHGGVSAIMPGSKAFIEVDLPAGEYGLLCFVPDMKDGKPHFVHGMSKQLKVS